MTFLLANYIVIFLLAAIFGFLIGRWSIRRSFVDVTDRLRRNEHPETHPPESDPSSTARLGRIEAKLDRLESRMTDSEGQRVQRGELRASSVSYTTGLETKPAAADDQADQRSDQSDTCLLNSPAYGPKDDLTKISGVGTKLEKSLNDIGVYYFWQIANWSPETAQSIDQRLESFSGRVDRDNWVAQARELTQRPETAPEPTR